MSSFSAPDDFMCGIYLVEFASPDEADRFIERYRDCPVWPVVTRGVQANQVFILAVELKRQVHGDFSQEHNTLAANPQYLGAREVRFKRDDGLLALLPGHELQTGYATAVPCGSECEACPIHQPPCRGCPAHYAYEKNAYEKSA